jgi:DNA-binding IclR family transcriptional regulator
VRDTTDGALGAGLALSGPAARVAAEPHDDLVDLLREHAERLAPLLA